MKTNVTIRNCDSVFRFQCPKRALSHFTKFCKHGSGEKELRMLWGVSFLKERQIGKGSLFVSEPRKGQ